MSNKTLRRKTLEQIQSAWESGGLNKPQSTRQPEQPRYFLAKNNTLAKFITGAAVKITGFSGSPTFAQAKQKLLSGRLVVTIATPASTDSAETSAVAADTILSHSLGKIQATGLSFGLVEINDSTHEYADATFSSVASGGVYKILAKSGLSNGYAVCALAKLSGGSGGLSGVTTETISIPTFTVLSTGTLQISFTSKTVVTGVQ